MGQLARSNTNPPLLAHVTTWTALPSLPLRSHSLQVCMQHISRGEVRHSDLLCLEQALAIRVFFGSTLAAGPLRLPMLNKSGQTMTSHRGDDHA